MKKSKLTTEERVLQLLLDKIKAGNDNCTYFDNNDLKKLSISDKEASLSLHLLKTDGLIFIRRCPSSKNFTISWSITLTSDGIHYFENQKQLKKDKRNNWIQFWIPVSLSDIAIIISIIALILELL